MKAVSPIRLFVFLFCVVFSGSLLFAQAEFGIPRSAHEQEVDAQGNAQQEQASSPYAPLAAKLRSHYPALPEQDAVDIAAFLLAARQDPETALLLQRMKQGSGQNEFQAFAADASPAELVQALAQATGELQMLEVLFRDPQRAVEEMNKEGMIPSVKLSLYKKDPALLEEDMRKSLYFMLVSAGAAGGYL